MNNKKERSLFVYGIIVILLVSISGIGVLAAENGDSEIDSEDSGEAEEIVEAGISPDSILYGLDKAIDRLRLAISLGSEKKSKKALEIAEERLAEVKKMIEEGKIQEADEAGEEHDNLIEESEQELENIDGSEDAEDIEESLRKIARLQDKIESHREKIIAIKTRILERQADRMTSEQIAHLEEVFFKIENRTYNAENKFLDRKDKEKIKYKVIAHKTDDELEEFENEIDYDEGFTENKKARAEREIVRAERALNALEGRFSIHNITEFDDTIAEMRLKISEAKEALEAGSYKEAKEVAHDVREFAEKIVSKARNLREAKAEGNGDKALRELREEAVKKRLETLRKVEKHFSEKENDVSEKIVQAERQINKARDVISEAVNGTNLSDLETILDRAETQLEKAKDALENNRVLVAMQLAKEAKMGADHILDILEGEDSDEDSDDEDDDEDSDDDDSDNDEDEEEDDLGEE